MPWKKYFQIITIILILFAGVYFLLPKTPVPPPRVIIVKEIPKVSAPVQPEDHSKEKVAKAEIQQAFEAYDHSIDEIIKSFPQESEALVNKYVAQGLVYQGDFIRSQMDLSLNTKKALDKRFSDLQIIVDDILKKSYGQGNVGNTFSTEISRLEEKKNKLKFIYAWLSQNPKSLEMKTFKELRVTKDFDVNQVSPAVK